MRYHYHEFERLVSMHITCQWWYIPQCTLTITWSDKDEDMLYCTGTEIIYSSKSLHLKGLAVDIWPQSSLQGFCIGNAWNSISNQQINITETTMLFAETIPEVTNHQHCCTN